MNMSPLCAEIPGADSIFFATDRDGQDLAKRVCALCHLKPQCAADAIEAERGVGRYERYGVFGGTTPRERFHADPGRECLECGASIADRKANAIRCIPCARERTLERNRQYIIRKKAA